MASGDGCRRRCRAGAWSHYVRFVGAGTIGVAAIWTLVKLVKPVLAGLAGAMAPSRARKAGQGATLPRHRAGHSHRHCRHLFRLLCLIPIAWLLGHFAMPADSAITSLLLVVGGVIFVVLMSFFVSAVCGYMAGLIGSSNSPLSGIGILVVIIAALLLVFGRQARCRAGAGQSAGRVRAVCDGGGLCGRDDRQQQPAGS